MPYVGKTFISQMLSGDCFPLKLDSLSTENAERSLSIETLNSGFIKSAKAGVREAYNKDFLILNLLINKYEENSLVYNWAVAHLLILLTDVCDPRLGLMEALAEHWAYCLRDDEEAGPSGGRLKSQMEGLGLGREVLKNYDKKIRLLKRTKNTWYPRARQQLNSREYLRTQLHLNVNAENFLSRDTQFVVMGTCFAQNIHNTLNGLGLPSAHLSLGEENPADVQFSIWMQREEFANYIRENKICFILTLGFAEIKILKKEIGENKKSGKLSNFAAPDSIAETVVDGVRRMKEINPDTRMFITLSPVPLEGTASEYTVFEANAISKAIVRYAIALAVEKNPDIEYFPSYEIVTQIAAAMGEGSFANDDGHPRHVNKSVVELICSLFIESYCPWALEGIG